MQHISAVMYIFACTAKHILMQYFLTFLLYTLPCAVCLCMKTFLVVEIYYEIFSWGVSILHFGRSQCAYLHSTFVLALPGNEQNIHLHRIFTIYIFLSAVVAAAAVFFFAFFFFSLSIFYYYYISYGV